MYPVQLCLPMGTIRMGPLITKPTDRRADEKAAMVHGVPGLPMEVGFIWVPSSLVYYNARLK